MKLQFDVVIVGAGFAGLATAYHLSKNTALKVALLDREALPSQHASGKNAGIVRQAVALEDAIPLIQESLAAYRDPPEDFAGRNFFRETGSLLLGDAARVDSLHRMLKAVGAESEIFSRGAYPENLDRQIHDQLASAGYDAALWTPGDGVVDVGMLSKNFFDAAMARGVAWFPSSPVRSFTPEKNRWVTRAGEHEFFSRVVVNSAGAWAKQLAPRSDAPDPMQPLRRHLVIAGGASKTDPAWPPIWNVSEEFYFRPELGQWLLSPGDEDLHPLDDLAPDPRAGEWLEKKLTRSFPALAGLKIERSWACFRAKIPGRGYRIAWQEPGYLWVAGLGGHGVSCCWGAGLRAAAEIHRNFS